MLKIFIATGLFSLTALFSNYAKADTPDHLAGTTLVDAKKAKDLVDAKSVSVIDSRVKVEFAEEHLPGAVSVQYTEKSAKDVNFDATKDSFDVKKLPTDKQQPILVYCNGPECWKSYKAATAAVKAGYKTVYWFRTGIPAWKSAGFATEK